MPTAPTCRLCGSDALEICLDLGPQPVHNRFPRPDEPDEARHPMRLAACRACGLGQLVDPPPPDVVRPLVDWITYNEPEGHLDRVADALARLPGLDPATARVAGITFKDASTLRRLEERGFRDTIVFDPERDLGITAKNAGLETLQAELDAARARKLVAREGAFDLVVARHVFEHAHRPARLLEALCALLRPEGRLVLELPDTTTTLALCDHPFLWEEHVSYFTPETLRSGLERLGMEWESLEVHPYPLENSLVGVLRVASDAAPGGLPAAPDGACESFARFGRSFPGRRSAWRAALDARTDAREVALFGAGHLTSKFVDFYGLADRIHFVVDDHPEKQGRQLPGSRLPILPTSAMTPDRVGLVLMGLSPESEERVVGKFASLTREDVRFASIFAGSKRCFLPS